jgi:hypothetical protein
VNKSKVKAFKRDRGSNYESFDKALFLWVKTKRLQKAPINGLKLRNKVFFTNQLKITNFKASNGHISRFVERFDIKYESKSEESESVSEILVNEWKTKLIEKYSNFEARNVWNFWRLIQNKNYSMPEQTKKRFNKSKDRVTALLLVNADGSQRLFVVIDKSREPHYFREIKNLPIWLYFYNTSA